MAYESVNNPRGPYLPLDEDFELNTRYDAGSHDNTLPATDTSGRNDKDRVEDAKIPFVSKGLPLGQWPANPGCVAIMTPWKALVMVFDALLASTPIMFIGRSIPNSALFPPTLRILMLSSPRLVSC